MHGSRRKSVTAFTAAIALVVGIVPAALTTSSILATGEGATTLTPATALTPGAIPAGSVVLSTTSTNGTVTFNGAIQGFTGGQQCEIQSLSGSAKLLTIQGSVGEGQTAVAGFRDGDIGVFESGATSPDNASQCFRVDAGSTTTRETLTLELPVDGPYSDEPFSDRLLAEKVTIDVRVGNSRSGAIEVWLKRATDGAWVSQAPVPWNNLKAGSKIPFPGQTLAGSFTAIRLVAASGSFSLRGATFDLISQADATFCPNDSYTDPDRSTTSVAYVGPLNGRCFGITLRSGEDFLQFLKPATVSPDAQFAFTARWTTANDGRLPSVQVRDAEIAFDLNESNFSRMEFCSTFLGLTDAQGAPILGRNTSGNLKLNNYQAFSTDSRFTDFESSVAAKQWACIDTRSVQVTEAQILVDDEIFAVGDLKTRY